MPTLVYRCHLSSKVGCIARLRRAAAMDSASGVPGLVVQLRVVHDHCLRLFVRLSRNDAVVVSTPPVGATPVPTGSIDGTPLAAMPLKEVLDAVVAKRPLYWPRLHSDAESGDPGSDVDSELEEKTAPPPIQLSTTGRGDTAPEAARNTATQDAVQLHELAIAGLRLAATDCLFAMQEAFFPSGIEDGASDQRWPVDWLQAVSAFYDVVSYHAVVSTEWCDDDTPRRIVDEPASLTSMLASTSALAAQMAGSHSVLDFTGTQSPNAAWAIWLQLWARANVLSGALSSRRATGSSMPGVTTTSSGYAHLDADLVDVEALFAVEVLWHMVYHPTNDWVAENAVDAVVTLFVELPTDEARKVRVWFALCFAVGARLIAAPTPAAAASDPCHDA